MIITEVETLDLISQLGKETVVEYEAEDATVSTIVSALLALQVQTPAITVGTIDGAYSALTRSIRVDGDTILRALYRLRDTVGGYIYVDNNRALQWTSSLGEDKGQQIRYRKNLKGIEREIDYTKLFNRIYAYGAGEGTARIKLSDAEGQTEDYVEDETSQTEWGGIYPGVFTERSITHPDTLLAWANLLLSDYKNPPICYRIDAVDLSQSEELGFSFEALQLGSTITVIDEDLGIDVSVIVVKIEHPDLLHPEQITLELANRTKDITDTLAEVYDKQQLDHHVATTIGAGQVIVKGVFTVIDWVTEGETTIDGGNIETGTIIADKIAAGAVTTEKLHAGAVTADKIWTGAITANKLEAELVLGSIIWAGANKVKLYNGGVEIYGGSVLRIYTPTSVYRGCIGAEGADFALVGIGGNIVLEADNNILLWPETYIRPCVNNHDYLGTSSYYWARVYAGIYYGKNDTIESFQNHDDIALLRSIKHKGGVLDIDTFPTELVETDQELETAKQEAIQKLREQEEYLERDKGEILAKRKLGETVQGLSKRKAQKALKEIEGQEQEIMKSIEKFMARKPIELESIEKAGAIRGINISAWQSLLMGSILQLANKIDILETRLEA